MQNPDLKKNNFRIRIAYQKLFINFINFSVYGGPGIPESSGDLSGHVSGHPVSGHLTDPFGQGHFGVPQGPTLVDLVSSLHLHNSSFSGKSKLMILSMSLP